VLGGTLADLTGMVKRITQRAARFNCDLEAEFRTKFDSRDGSMRAASPQRACTSLL